MHLVVQITCLPFPMSLPLKERMILANSGTLEISRQVTSRSAPMLRFKPKHFSIVIITKLIMHPNFSFMRQESCHKTDIFRHNIFN